MTSNVFLRIKKGNYQFKRIIIDNINLQDKVKILRERASRITKRPEIELELVYFGKVLLDDCTLCSYDVKSGGTIHVLEKIIPEIAPPSREVPEKEFQMFLRNFEKYGHGDILKAFSEAHVIDKLISDVPNLLKDPEALALIQDPKLLRDFSNPLVLRKILEIHPVLADTLTPIIIYLKENSARIPNPAISNSEASDVENSQHPLLLPLLTSHPSFVDVIDAQLSTAVTNAIGKLPTGDVDSIFTPGSVVIITKEMVQEAVEQAMVNVPGDPASYMFRDGQLPIEEESMENVRARLQPQLQQMRDMGLTHDALNLRALLDSSGKVADAIELLFMTMEY